MANMSFHLLITTEILPDIAIFGSLNLESPPGNMHIRCMANICRDSHLTNACIYEEFQQKIVQT